MDSKYLQAKEKKELQLRAALGAGKRTKSSGHFSGNKKQDYLKVILRDAAQLDFENEADAQAWNSKHKERLLRSNCKILFLLLTDEKVVKRWEDPERRRTFLRWVLGMHHHLLEVTDEYDMTPLLKALFEGNFEFVEVVLEHQGLVNIRSVLSYDCLSTGNALHAALKAQYRSIELFELLVERCAEIKDMFVACTPKHGSPLHICMSMDIQGESGGDDSEDGSEGLEDEDEDRDTEDGFVLSSPVSRRRMGAADGDGPADLNSPVAGMQGMQGLHGNLKRRTTFVVDVLDDRREEMLTATRLLIKANQAALLQKNEEGRTPYQERIYQLQKMEIHQQLDEGAMQLVITEDPVTDFIRSYCIRNMPRDHIIKCLYQPGQERHLEFDLGGLPQTNISESYLDRLSRHLRFESTLKYVALPRLTMDISSRKSRMQGRKEMGDKKKGRGLSDLVAVFHWLHTRGVKKIFKVMVIDDGDPSHSDASIEEALHKFGVEVWDWKRVDLNPDVIHRCSRVVREVSLYSSGNNAVLMGWASTEGLRSEELFPELRQVNLFIRKVEGLEDPDTLKSYTTKFEERMKARPGVEIRTVDDDKLVSYASELGNSDEADNEWMSMMKNFSGFLSRAYPEPNESGAIKTPKHDDLMRIKIAIIDDGVDANFDFLDGRIAIGKSFCSYANSSELIGSYYVPTGNHGTCMASIISSICPEVSLYVARLDERVSQRSRSNAQFTTKSAAEAIRWATSCDVDIISMSWTIEAAINDEGTTDLKEAVAQAHRKKILMFCSTSDQGSSAQDACYPRDIDGCCIRIGGASDSGDTLSWVNADKVDFLLTGKNYPFKNNENKIASYESGSSVATAAASGLAGLLLYCGRILDRWQRKLGSAPSPTSALLTRGLGSNASLLSSSSMSSSATMTAAAAAAGTGGEGKVGPRGTRLRERSEMMQTFKKLCDRERKFPDVKSFVGKKFPVYLKNVREQHEKNGDQRGSGGRRLLPQELKAKDLLDLEWDDEMFRALELLFVNVFPQIA